MKVGTVVNELPVGRSKHRKLWEQAEGLKKGEFLPVTFESKKEARLFYQGAWNAGNRSKHPRNIRCFMRETTVYLSRAE